MVMTSIVRNDTNQHPNLPLICAVTVGDNANSGNGHGEIGSPDDIVSDGSTAKKVAAKTTVATTAATTRATTAAATTVATTAATTRAATTRAATAVAMTAAEKNNRMTRSKATAVRAKSCHK